jgi:hypothetical protein
VAAVVDRGGRGPGARANRDTDAQRQGSSR